MSEITVRRIGTSWNKQARAFQVDVTTSIGQTTVLFPVTKFALDLQGELQMNGYEIMPEMGDDLETVEGLFSWVSKAAGSIGKAVGGAVSSVAKGAVNAAVGVAKAGFKGVVSPVANAIAKVDPVTGFLGRVVKGERVDKALAGAVADQRALAKVAAPLMKAVATGGSFIPGVGTVAATALNTAAAWGQGKSIPEALLGAAKNSLPGGAITGRALDVAAAIAGGQRVDKAVQAAAVQAVYDHAGPLAGKAAESAVRIARGENPALVAKSIGIDVGKQALGRVPFPAVGGPALNALAAAQKATNAFDAAKAAADRIRRGVPLPNDRMLVAQGQAVQNRVRALGRSNAPMAKVLTSAFRSVA